MQDNGQIAVEKEIESLHEFFVGWFTGSLPEESFEEVFLPRFCEDVIFIPPAGNFFGFKELSNAIRSGYGSNPGFRIQIRNVTVHRELDGFVLATYEEWQRNALASTPPDNGRLATVLFMTGERLQWAHIHETWLPAEIMERGPYDF